MRLSTDTSRLRHLLLVAIGQEEIGRRIKEARESADLTQQELADRIGIKQGQTISNYERGVTEVSSKRLRRIAEATGKPISFFVQDPDGEPTEPEVSDLRAELAEVRGELAAVRRLLEERLPAAREGQQRAV